MHSVRYSCMKPADPVVGEPTIEKLGEGNKLFFKIISGFWFLMKWKAEYPMNAGGLMSSR